MSKKVFLILFFALLSCGKSSVSIISNEPNNSTPDGGGGVVCTPPGDLSASIADAQVVEGGNLVFNVTINQTYCADFVATYTISDGTATTADTDYSLPPSDSDSSPGDGFIVIPEGSAAGTITISTVADGTNEPNERLSVVLSLPSHGTLSDATAEGTIITDESAFVCDSGNLSTTCTINTVRNIANLDYVSGGGNLLIQNLGSIQNTTNLETITIDMIGSVTVQSGGAIIANLPDFRAGNLIIDAGGIVQANGLGQLGGHSNANAADGDGTGGGLGASANNNGAGGGAYGGDGGTGQNSAGGSAYGNRDPSVTAFTFGSGGGGVLGAAAAGGDGGGYIKMIIASSLTVNGTLSVNGEDGLAAGGEAGGGGSGGGLDLTVGSISGGGTISATGGRGFSSSNNDGGGGGGGRIFLSSSNPFGGSIALGGGTVTQAAALPGNIGSFLFTLTDNDGFCSSGTLSTTCTVSNTVILSDGFSLTGTGNLVIDGTGIIMVAKNLDAISLTMDGDITVQNGGQITANLTLLQGNNITVDAGGLISANEIGHYGGFQTGSQDGLGSGGGTGYDNHSGAGGGGAYGGAGGLGRGGYAGGMTYGDKNPDVTAFTFGSGGGGVRAPVARGGNGGGLLKITATNLLTLNGTISANGEVGYANSGEAGGAGSGGGIDLRAAQVTGSGTISATGGNGVQNSGYASGGGGGGRIALFSNNPFKGTVNLSGGTFMTSPAVPGEKGTFYFNMNDPDGLCDSGSVGASCTLSSSVIVSDGFSLTGAGDLIISGTGSINLPNSLDAITINMSGNITIQNGGSINGNISSLQADNLTIDAGGSINADGKGHRGGYVDGNDHNGNGSGAGTGNTGNNNGGGGGAYGGNGGNGEAANAGGSAYGNRDPGVTAFTYGSGGGAVLNGSAYGGNGGGLIKITTTNTLTINGTISANGTQGGVDNGEAGGGGSGGGIDLHAATLAGNGSISANGANGRISSNFSSGGGGGGRIYIEADTPFIGTVSVTGGTMSGDPAMPGQVGSFYFNMSNVDGLCDSGTMASTCTISSAVKISDSFAISGAGNLVIDGTGSITVINNLDTISFNMTGDITVQNGGSIVANISSMNADNITIDLGGLVSANGLGEVGGFKSGASTGDGAGGGAGVNSANNGGGGGAYGGAGGLGEGPNAGGSVYGNADPLVTAFTYGSGGGGIISTLSRGGDGGGLIKMTAATTLTVNGTISANGAIGGLDVGEVGGGGSGGGIDLTAGSVAGTGSITANGADGRSSSGIESGGGGGGRISVNTTDASDFDAGGGSFSVAGGTATGGAVNGSAGSLLEN